MIELLEGYIIEFNIRTLKETYYNDNLNSNINDVLIKSFIEKDLLKLI